MYTRYQEAPVRCSLALVIALVACNSAPVLPPEDDRVIELVETDLWSGGELRAVVRHAEGVEAPVSMVLGGEAATVTRIDDTTFAAALPVHTGELPVRVERADLPTLESAVRLHGFLSAAFGPAIGGSVLPLSGNVVLGASRDGVATVSLESGQVATTWPRTVHAIECANGIVPGPEPGQVILRGIREIDGECQGHYSIHAIGTQGVGSELAPAMPGWGRSIAAVVGPRTAVLGFHDNWGQFFRCTTGSPWTDCQPLPPFNDFQANLYGFEAGYNAGRILGLGIKTALHDLATGDIVRILPHDDGGGLMYYHAATFNEEQDRIIVAAWRGQVSAIGSGAVLVLDADDGSEVARREFTDGSPIGIAMDEDRDLLYVAKLDKSARKVSLVVLDAGSLAPEAELPVNDVAIGEAVWRHEHHRLLLSPGGDRVALVSTRYVPWWDVTPIPPMVIARWSLRP